jgi:hypothetical protein
MFNDNKQLFFFPQKFQKRLNIDTKLFYKKDYNILEHPSPRKGDDIKYKTHSFKDLVLHHKEEYHYRTKI